MNVLFVTHYPGFGGANQSALHLMRLLRDRHGVNPIATTPFNGSFVDKMAEEGIPCHTIRYASWRGPRTGIKGLLFAVATLLVNLVALPKGLLLVKSAKIDIIHINSSLAFYGWLLGKIARRPVVWHLREFGDKDYPMSFYFGTGLSGKIIGASDAVIAISEAIRNYYSKFVRDDSRMHVIYNGVDVNVSIAQMSRSQSGIDILEGFKLCTIGSISDSKNQIEVVRALGALKSTGRLGNICYYVIGGGNGDTKQKFDNLVASIGLGDVVHVLGEQDNIWPLASRMDAFVVPSKNEGFGRVVVAGMLCSKPVIVANAGALPELIDDGADGLIYELGNEQALADRIDELHSNEDMRRRLGTAARKKAEECFDASINADKVFNLYEDLL